MCTIHQYNSFAFQEMSKTLGNNSSKDHLLRIVYVLDYNGGTNVMLVELYSCTKLYQTSCQDTDTGRRLKNSTSKYQYHSHMMMLEIIDETTNWIIRFVFHY